jgi:hypothetical protein
MVAGAESATESVERVPETTRINDQNDHVRDLLFLMEFAKNQHGELRRSRPKQPIVEGIDPWPDRPPRTASGAVHRHGSASSTAI